MEARRTLEKAWGRHYRFMDNLTDEQESAVLDGLFSSEVDMVSFQRMVNKMIKKAGENMSKETKHHVKIMISKEKHHFYGVDEDVIVKWNGEQFECRGPFEDIIGAGNNSAEAVFDYLRQKAACEKN